jgi:hypothetical protein
MYVNAFTLAFALNSLVSMPCGHTRAVSVGGITSLRVQTCYWDRSRARPAVGGGFPFLLFRLQDGFTVPPWLTFPEAPL